MEEEHTVTSGTRRRHEFPASVSFGKAFHINTPGKITITLQYLKRSM